MSVFFPAPAVFSGAARTPVTHSGELFRLSFCSASPSGLVYKHDRRRKLHLISQGSESGAGRHVDVSLAKQCDCEIDEIEDEWVVVNFYEFVKIEDAEGEVAKHLRFLEGVDIRGRIYINEQGINAQYSGRRRDAVEYVEWVREDERFADVLVQLEGGISHLPLLDPIMRATPLAPSEWRKRLEAVDDADTVTRSSNADYILLDVRNGYEWDIGHFSGARRPDVDCFRSTSFGLSQPEVIAADPLANVDKETDILMYCTGDIFGVMYILQSLGPVQWVGNLFLFDSRLSLPPATYNPEATTEPGRIEVSENNTFARCYTCGLQVYELRHRNCANLDCNLLYLCCMNCVENLRGCCCSKCTMAPRLRPVIQGPHRYEKWHMYRDLISQSKSDSLITS